MKRILGTVPVHEDGSAYFTIPANTPISLQPLDAQGKALQLMRSWFTAMPGEHISCVGCHNGQPRQAGQPIPDLRGGRIAGPNCRDPALGVLHPANCQCGAWHLWPTNRSVSYEILQRYVRRPGSESDYHLLPPLEYHADTSELIQMLKKGHHGVELDAEARDRLVTWIDLNVPYHGNWGEYHIGQPGAAERRREYAKLFASLDEDPELLPPVPREPVTPVMPSAQAKPDLPEITAPGWPFGRDEARKRQQDAAASFSTGKARQTDLKLDLGDGLAIHLVLIPAGEFVMGAARGFADERPLAKVSIEKPFWMGKFEVTNQQYARFNPQHDSRYISVFGKDLTYRGLPVNRSQQPVVRVPWTGAVEFCRWLSAKTGRQFSLPSEAQWEWACRCGSAEAMSYGDVEADFGTLANLADRQFVLVGDTGQWPATAFDWIPKVAAVDDSARVTADVGKYAASAWGLHDMHGNAAEWTRSLYRPYPYQDEDGCNNTTGAGPRVVRGGSFHDRPHRARSAFRLGYPEWAGVYGVGFRVACDD